MSPGHDSQRIPVSYFDVLNVSAAASDEEVRRAYRRLAIKHHPDHNPYNRELSKHRFHLITEAYANIKTEQQRLAYAKRIGKIKVTTAANQNRRTSGTSWLTQIADFLGLWHSDKKAG